MNQNRKKTAEMLVCHFQLVNTTGTKQLYEKEQSVSLKGQEDRVKPRL